jgi:type VI secretion system protein
MPLAAMLLLSGCSAYHLVVPRTVRVRWIEFRVVERANENTPIAVDIAYLAANPALIEEVAKMTADDWFSRKEQLRRDYRDEVEMASWELVPGTVTPRAKLDKPAVTRAAFLFARYHAPSPHRYRLTDDDDDILVRLDTDDFSVTAR